jgi:hypothetical protein
LIKHGVYYWLIKVNSGEVKVDLRIKSVSNLNQDAFYWDEVVTEDKPVIKRI